MKNKQLITPLRRRRITGLTPCNFPLPPVRLHSLTASKGEIARGYPSLNPTNFELLKKCLFFRCMLLTFNLAAQKKKVVGDFFSLTNDVILWDNVEYMCSQSPLSEFDDFKTIFGELTTLTHSEGPADLDKNYKAKWAIRNNALYLLDVESPLFIFENYKNIFSYPGYITSFAFIPYMPDKNYIAKWTIVDDMLYLYDIELEQAYKQFEIFSRHDANRLEAVEKLTGMKFRQRPALNKKAIFAEWYNGIMYVKRYPNEGEDYRSCDFKCELFYKLTLEKGKIVSKEETSFMIRDFKADKHLIF